MNKHMRRILPVFLFFIIMSISTVATAQQENTLYFMDRVPQSHYLNPAQHPDCRWWMSGVLVPVWVIPMFDPPFVHFPMHMDFSMPLDLNDFVLYEDGKPSRTFLYSVEDQDNFLKKLSKINYISFNTSVEYAFMGFKQDKNFWTFSLNDIANASYSFSKDMVALPLKGNVELAADGSLEGRATNLKGTAINMTYYREAAIGFNHQFSRYFRVGMRAKALFGQLNINTSKADLTVNSIEKSEAQMGNGDYQPFVIESDADYLINASIPVTVETDSNNIVDKVTLNDLTAKDLANFKNYGWGLDFGLMKDWNSELTIYASVIDFGFIYWKNNVHNYSLNGKYNFSGLEITDIENLDIDPDSILSKIGDSYKVKYTNKSYKTMLSTKGYFGGNYKFTKKVAVGLLGKIEKYPYSFEYSATASLNLKPFKWGAFTLSYSYFKRNFTNIGMGYTIRIGPLQWYSVYDNLIGALIFPENSRYWSMRWGVNMVFGRGANKKKPQKNLPLLWTL